MTFLRCIDDFFNVNSTRNAIKNFHTEVKDDTGGP